MLSDVLLAALLPKIHHTVHSRCCFAGIMGWLLTQYHMQGTRLLYICDGLAVKVKAGK